MRTDERYNESDMPPEPEVRPEPPAITGSNDGQIASPDGLGTSLWRTIFVAAHAAAGTDPRRFSWERLPAASGLSRAALGGPIAAEKETGLGTAEVERSGAIGPGPGGERAEAEAEVPETEKGPEDQVALAEQIAARIEGRVLATENMVSMWPWVGGFSGHRVVKSVLDNSAVLVNKTDVGHLPEPGQKRVERMANEALDEKKETYLAEKITFDRDDLFPEEDFGPSPQLAPKLSAAGFEGLLKGLARAHALAETKVFPHSTTVVGSLAQTLRWLYLPDEDGNGEKRSLFPAEEVGVSPRGEEEVPPVPAGEVGGGEVREAGGGEDARAPEVALPVSKEGVVPPPEPVEETSPEASVSPAAAPLRIVKDEEAERDAAAEQERGKNGLTPEEETLIEDLAPRDLLRAATLLHQPDLPGEGPIALIADGPLVAVGKALGLKVSSIGRSLAQLQEIEDNQAIGAAFDASPLSQLMAANNIKAKLAEGVGLSTQEVVVTEVITRLTANGLENAEEIFDLVPVAGLRTWNTVYSKLEAGEPVSEDEWFDLYFKLASLQERLEMMGGKLRVFESKASNILKAKLESLSEADREVVAGWQQDLLDRTVPEDEDEQGRSAVKQLQDQASDVLTPLQRFYDDIDVIRGIAARRCLGDSCELNIGRLRRIERPELAALALGVPLALSEKGREAQMGVLAELTRSVSPRFLMEQLLAEWQREGRKQALLSGEIVLGVREGMHFAKELPLVEVMREICATSGCEFSEQILAEELAGWQQTHSLLDSDFLTFVQLRIIAESMLRKQGGDALTEAMSDYKHSHWLRALGNWVGGDIGGHLLEYAPSVGAILKPAEQADVALLESLFLIIPDDALTYAMARKALNFYAAAGARYQPTHDVGEILASRPSELPIEWTSAETAFPLVQDQFFPDQWPVVRSELTTICGIVRDAQREGGVGFDLLERRVEKASMRNVIIIGDAGCGKSTEVAILAEESGAIFLVFSATDLGTAMLKAGMHTDELAQKTADFLVRNKGKTYEEAVELLRSRKVPVIVFFDEAPKIMGNRGDTEAHRGVGGADPEALRATLLTLLTRERNMQTVKHGRSASPLVPARETQIDIGHFNFFFAGTIDGSVGTFLRAVMGLSAEDPIPIDPLTIEQMFDPAFASRIRVIGHPPSAIKAGSVHADPAVEQLVAQMREETGRLLDKPAHTLTPGESYVGQCYLWTQSQRCPQHRIKDLMADEIGAAVTALRRGVPTRVECELTPDAHKVILQQACRPEGGSNIVTLRWFEKGPEELSAALIELCRGDIQKMAAEPGRRKTFVVTGDMVERALALLDSRRVSVH